MSFFLMHCLFKNIFFFYIMIFLLINYLEAKDGRSYLRSSDWNLVRLEGDMINQGIQCTFLNSDMRCQRLPITKAQVDGEEKDESVLVLERGGTFELTITGFINSVKRLIIRMFEIHT